MLFLCVNIHISDFANFILIFPGFCAFELEICCQKEEFFVCVVAVVVVVVVCLFIFGCYLREITCFLSYILDN